MLYFLFIVFITNFFLVYKITKKLHVFCKHCPTILTLTNKKVSLPKKIHILFFLYKEIHFLWFTMPHNITFCQSWHYYLLLMLLWYLLIYFNLYLDIYKSKIPLFVFIVFVAERTMFKKVFLNEPNPSDNPPGFPSIELLGMALYSSQIASRWMYPVVPIMHLGILSY